MLLREDTLLGIIALYRSRVECFTDKQIALAATFADQAVIAIENARLFGELRDRQAELRVTFDNMADGVAMFDQTLHLAAWNRNFQELLDLPDELLAERLEFGVYIRYLTERGEFGERKLEGEIARLRSRRADHYSFERIRPDGTVIEIRNNPMPDGGVVFIYLDWFSSPSRGCNMGAEGSHANALIEATDSPSAAPPSPCSRTAMRALEGVQIGYGLICHRRMLRFASKLVTQRGASAWGPTRPRGTM